MREHAGFWITAIFCCFPVSACSKHNETPPGKVRQLETVAETEDKQPPFFEDITAASGIDFTYRNGEEAGQYAILETLGGGVGLIDYDGDGLLDIFLPGGGYFEDQTIRGHPCRLYRNLGQCRFRDVTADVTAEAGLDQPLFYSHGCAVADYDNDGWPDLLVTGFGGVILYHNEPDDNDGRRFVNDTQKAGLNNPLWSTSAAWGDLNGDGYVDLYIAHYLDWSVENHPRCPGYVPTQAVDVCSPQSFQCLPSIVYFNNGDGSFRDASREAGLRTDGKGLGVLIADLDEDGKPDIYVANDLYGNFLYLNQGGGRFEEVGQIRGVAHNGWGGIQGSMGVDAADYDGSGRLSIFVTNFHGEAHALYRNMGSGQFHYVSEAAGLAAVGKIYVGFGTAFLDYDRDGAEDLFYVNGHVTHHPPAPSEYKQRPFLLRNIRQTSTTGALIRFKDVSAQGGPFFNAKRVGRGVACGDLDNDGRTDLVISHTNEPVVVLRNTADNGHHWIGVALEGKPNRDAIGATVTLELPSQKLVRQVKGGGSYLSSNDPRIIFGLGAIQEAGRLTVRWPSGTIQSWEGLTIDRYWRLVEGEAAAK